MKTAPILPVTQPESCERWQSVPSAARAGDSPAPGTQRPADLLRGHPVTAADASLPRRHLPPCVVRAQVHALSTTPAVGAMSHDEPRAKARLVRALNASRSRRRALRDDARHRQWRARPATDDASCIEAVGFAIPSRTPFQRAHSTLCRARVAPASPDI
eukprot:CAMPEP_0206018426 /NCGR_PEP_ID=MMETSP1464-20131121/27096_1 /ASSEMBLY_ACC=CAM_ASM_001124 /TAXON_ID=119497 /ORGANISM="Exanthemachrysis gayraliae, Strain RCC1523" /LENGTH=158 /DNA_ID=CAMNT_0053392297 /DNA_START=37 /DNA_END=515 /DNA_ORIENTATION=+